MLGFALIVIAGLVTKVVKDVTNLPNPVTPENQGAIL